MLFGLTAGPLDGAMLFGLIVGPLDGGMLFGLTAGPLDGGMLFGLTVGPMDGAILFGLIVGPLDEEKLFGLAAGAFEGDDGFAEGPCERKPPFHPRGAAFTVIVAAIANSSMRILFMAHFLSFQSCTNAWTLA